MKYPIPHTTPFIHPVIPGIHFTIQQIDYYSFGQMIYASDTETPFSEGNRYLYNGKELKDDFGLDWYDYGARFYDGQIARWHSVDPLAERGYQQSPYNYVFNNPIGFVDPDGKFRTRIGAWLYKAFSGGDEIHEHEESGQYYVTKDNVSNEDGTNTIASTVRCNWSGGNEPALYDQNGGIKSYGEGGGKTKTTARNPDEESIENPGIPSFQPGRIRRSKDMGMIVAELVMRIAGIFQANSDNRNEDQDSNESNVAPPDQTDNGGQYNQTTLPKAGRPIKGWVIIEGDSMWNEQRDKDRIIRKRSKIKRGLYEDE